MTLVNTPTHITNKLVVILMLHKCVFYFRYDLRIRYIPVDFMKRLKAAISNTFQHAVC